MGMIEDRDSILTQVHTDCLELLSHENQLSDLEAGTRVPPRGTRVDSSGAWGALWSSRLISRTHTRSNIIISTSECSQVVNRMSITSYSLSASKARQP